VQCIKKIGHLCNAEPESVPGDPFSASHYRIDSCPSKLLVRFVSYICPLPKQTMNKLTLQFSSLEGMVQFSKLLSGGFLMNTIRINLVGVFTDFEISIAIEQYDATLVETTDKIYH
jgi:hypothetical protein